MTSIFIEPAPAKLNLFLHVTGKRDDGYHLLDSLVCFAEYGDVVSATRRDDTAITLAISGPMAGNLSDGNPDDNLVMRAARLLQTEGKVSQGADLTLEKNLPVASGIGGGSADAAATLRVLCKLWQLDIPADRLAALALSLGADVPVCLGAKTVLMQGIGDELIDLPELPNLSLVLVNPGCAVATADVFHARVHDDDDNGNGRDFTDNDLWDRTAHFNSGASLAAALQDCRNDLTLPASGILPEICDVLQALAREEGCLLARMSGSGATCFAIYDTDDQATNAANMIATEQPDWWVQPTRIQSHDNRALSQIGASFPA
ncbi:4-(cytidine 5'-diphospho)-2-C-methyl-D-erythritol kinase [Thalassospira alkalitolerans]|uniref:4-(cytidine 5'-diphospho)-2-C-methyl-D-erythritol kinase n=1 Tax=Thalassospira alkalitolerans TaxID=1293890 RepID=UPI003AA9D261|tara:strand:- start:56540 stop:57493 length:954 start_codon:yes stop_codon:yes gene_type:complete